MLRDAAIYDKVTLHKYGRDYEATVTGIKDITHTERVILPTGPCEPKTQKSTRYRAEYRKRSGKLEVEWVYPSELEPARP